MTVSFLVSASTVRHHRWQNADCFSRFRKSVRHFIGTTCCALHTKRQKKAPKTFRLRRSLWRQSLNRWDTELGWQSPSKRKCFLWRNLIYQRDRLKREVNQQDHDHMIIWSHDSDKALIRFWFSFKTFLDFLLFLITYLGNLYFMCFHCFSALNCFKSNDKLLLRNACKFWPF